MGLRSGSHHLVNLVRSYLADVKVRARARVCDEERRRGGEGGKGRG